jgi:hypothetical protein
MRISRHGSGHGLAKVDQAVSCYKLGAALSALSSPPVSHPALRRYAFLAIPAIAVLELFAHLVQISRRIPDADWQRARDAVQAVAQPEDLVVFAPFWADPLGREHFKDQLATVEREARPDDTRFPRAFEVSIRGAHLGELDGWKAEGRQRFGAITVTTWKNPAPASVIDDLVAHVAPERAHVSVFDGGNETDCGWVRDLPQTGGIGFGPAIPSERVACPRGGFVAVSVLQATDYRPHKCIYVPPLGGANVIRIRFVGVELGHSLHGHHAISWDQARYQSPPVTLVWKVEGRTIAHLVDGDADGWKPFEIDTSDWVGQKLDLVAEVSAPNSGHRQYCFEADTR